MSPGGARRRAGWQGDSIYCDWAAIVLILNPGFETGFLGERPDSHESEVELRPRPKALGEEGAWPVDHTADVALRVKAPTLPALFTHAALGMARLALGEEWPGDCGSGRQDEARPVTVEGLDCEELLVCWLNELLYLGDSEGLWVVEVRSLEIGSGDTPVPAAEPEKDLGDAGEPGYWLRAECRFRPGDGGGGGGSSIKAVTYHRLRIDPRTRDGYDQLIVFDT